MWEQPPAIVLLVATQRGLRFLKHLHGLAPNADLTVFSFREDPAEPPFLKAIRDYAQEIGASFYAASSVASATEFWSSQQPDLMLAVSWRYLIPPAIYTRPRRGTFIFHDALLPEYRGFAPTVWAIANGAERTGVSLIQAAEEADTGDIVDQQAVTIDADETIAEVMEHVTETYLQMLERNLESLVGGTFRAQPQDHSRATYCCRRTEEDYRIDWSWSARRIWNLIRASTHPYQGAWTTLDGERLRIWDAHVPTQQRRFVTQAPGRVVGFPPGGVLVLTGDGVICISQVGIDQATLRANEMIRSLSTTLH